MGKLFSPSADVFEILISVRIKKIVRDFCSRCENLLMVFALALTVFWLPVTGLTHRSIARSQDCLCIQDFPVANVVKLAEEGR